MHAGKPRIAVIIPVFQARYLDACLASVFAQTHPPDEIIVVDDGSPDPDTVDAVTSHYHSRVRIRCRLRLLRQQNLGAGAARNRGILSTNADLVAFLDADDTWASTLLEKQLIRLRRNPDVALVYSNGIVIGEGPLVGTRLMDQAPSVGDATVEALLAQRCTVFTSSTVVRRQALLDAGLFDVELRRGQDFDLWVRLAHRGLRIAYTTEPLIMRRVHEANLSGDRLSELQRAVAVLRTLATKLTLTPSQQQLLDARVRTLRAAIHTEHGKQSLAIGALAEAQRSFSRAARNRAGWKVYLVHLGLTVAPSLTRQLYVMSFRRHDGQRFGAAVAAAGGPQDHDPLRLAE